jgi:photosystem II stability/assembly factor-like uncharacterized protein
MHKKLLSFSGHPIFKKILTLGFTALAILNLAASCTLPGLNLGSINNSGLVLGVLKKDPAISKSFGKINSVKTLDGSVNKQGLGNISTLAIEQIDKDNYYLLTKNKGFFVTKDGGKLWSRQYIYPIRTNSGQADLAANDSFQSTSIKVDPANKNLILISGTVNGVGKIFRSVNGGKNWDEAYTEIDTNTEILSLAIDPKNNANVFALLKKGVLLGSSDSGQSWRKVNDFSNTGIKIGFVPQFNNLFYILLQNKGLLISSDNGATWVEKKLSRSTSSVGESQGLNFNLQGSNFQKFSNFEDIIPVEANLDTWLVIADKQLWLGEGLDNPFQKLVFPLQDERYNFAAIAPDPVKGKERILASIDNQLFETKNQGQSWSISSPSGRGVSIGNISSILVDKTNPEIVYLTLRVN